MSDSARPCRQHGFTLLELMVVIVIVAVLFSFMALSVRTGSPRDLIEEEALRFSRLVQLIRDESVLRNQDYGIAFATDGYTFLQFEADDEEAAGGRWNQVTDELYRQRELEHDIEIDLVLDDSDTDMNRVLVSADDAKLRPQVFVLSSDEITPGFAVEFFIPTEPVRYRVLADSDGRQHAEIIR